MSTKPNLRCMFFSILKSPKFILYVFSCLLLLSAVSLFFTLEKAEAVPSFARQTGYACTACHYQSFGPALNAFGREFKLLGYVLGKPNKMPPVSAMALGSFTNTGAGQPGGAAPGFGENNNYAIDQVSLFYAGRIWSKIGAFSQATWDGVAHQWAIDNTDIRFATTGTFVGKPSVFGIDLNNNPTSQDLWNTTPAWGFPYVSSALAPTPAASTLIDGGLAQQVAGVTAYTMINNLLYIELGPYVTLPSKLQDILGVEPEGENRINGVAPYWRIVLQHDWKGNYISAGTFGLLSWVYPGRVESAGTDRYTDLGFDLSYQYSGFKKQYIALNSAFIKEYQELSASQQLGYSSNSSDSLETFRTNVNYTIFSKIAFTAGYFQTTGSTDTGLYQPEPISGSANGSPDSKGYILELDLVPFGQNNSFKSPYLNLRVGLQYTGYWKFNGASDNYDGSGRNASDNNTLYLFLWWAI
jgi:hypothetical protein